MFLSSAICIDNPLLVFPEQARAVIINPFGDEEVNSSDGEYSQYFHQFEGYACILSGLDWSNQNLYLVAVPGKSTQIYRNFSIFIFSNMPCFYEVRFGDQVYCRGRNEWKSVVKASSEYSDETIRVVLVNDSNVSLAPMVFTVALLDSPWSEEGGGDGGGSGVVAEEWVRFSRGDFSNWVLERMAVDLVMVLFGAVVGTSYAAIKADFGGIIRAV